MLQQSVGARSRGSAHLVRRSEMLRGSEQAGVDEMKMMAQILHKISQRDLAGEQYRFIITNTEWKISARAENKQEATSKT